MERAINKRTNVNHRLREQIASSEPKQKETPPATPDADKKDRCYINLALFSDNDLEKCTDVAEKDQGSATEDFIDLV